MNIWILSQDKLELANVNDVYIIVEKKESRIIGYTNGIKCYLGEYETEQRAKEVLKEIMNILSLPQQHIEDEITYYMPNDGSSKVYEMPER